MGDHLSLALAAAWPPVPCCPCADAQPSLLVQRRGYAVVKITNLMLVRNLLKALLLGLRHRLSHGGDRLRECCTWLLSMYGQ